MLSLTMRRSLWLVSVVAVLCTPSPARAWEIASFETSVTIHEDATATIHETIVVDFDGERRHGLYRDIPIHYSDRAGQHFTMRLRLQEIANRAGQPWPYQVESAGRYLRIRIGDPDVTVTGAQTYRLSYEVQRGAVRFFPEHDECYWNLTGNEWAVPVRQVRAEIHLPPSATQMRAVAYVGGYGSTRQRETLRVLEHGVVFEIPEGLGPYEGLTAAVGWAKGAVHPPRAERVVGWWLGDNWVYGVPLLVLLGMLWLWHEKGRDPRPGRSQVVEYEPPDGLSPAEVGTLMDQRAHLRDITSTVVDVAVRGFLRIEPHQTTVLGMRWVSDYRLVSLKAWEGDATLKPHERDLLKGIFGRPNATKDLSDLQNVFYTKLSSIRDHLYHGLVKAGYLDSHPQKVRTGYLVLGLVLGLVVWVGLGVLQAWSHVPPLATALASGLSSLIVIMFSRIMPRRTLKGAQATDKIFGFLEFLRRADADRIRRINDPGLFERGLPYALAFGVADRWARAFEGLYTQPPSWYAGDWESFSPRRLGSDLDRATSSMGQTFASSPRSSGGSSSSWGGSGFGGGGSSGGGGGGGGGGAW